ncbi:MAG: hypothetical protein EOP43_07455 [Sphingobacteriaceae bacterium]|nr:MAG: hypothetical protein EOP43_07455 [Sphingobacteriaceae bacterium]
MAEPFWQNVIRLAFLLDKCYQNNINLKVMFFKTTPLRDKIIKLIINNPIPYRNTDIINPYLVLSITLFFNRFKTVLLNELYYKGLVELHGDVDLFIKAKKAADTKYLNIGASLTQKGLAYYRMNVQKEENTNQLFSVEMQPEPVSTSTQKPNLSIVR